MSTEEARAEIRDCILRAARGIDRHDVELILSAYHDDALDDHGYFVGTARDFAHRAHASHGGWPSHMHYIMNQLIWFDAKNLDLATSETYFIMVGRRASHEVDLNGGRYLDRFEHRDGRWAIASRICTIEWTSNTDFMPELIGHFILGSQDRADPSYDIAGMAGRPHRDIRPFES